ncbi:hypothetical protein OROGR_005442 [Orobanche gracilis]
MWKTRTTRVPVLLPWELWIEILSWLPVKSLMKFRRVSKSWKSLISDDKSFAKMHQNRSPRNNPLLLMTPEVIPSTTLHFLKEPSFMVGDDPHAVVGSCNGLVCLVSWKGAVCFWVRFWNPATRLMSEISPTFGYNCPVRMNFGFCYDDSRDTYKVVVVLRDCRKRTTDTRAHCMGDGTWRKILSDPGFPVMLKPVSGQVVGGCVNWLGLDKLNCHYDFWEDANVTLQQLIIVSLGMHEEEYRLLSLPPEDVSHEEHHEKSNLGFLRNCLCLFHDHKRTHFVVWQMREYGVRESWTRLVSVTYEHLRCDGFPRLRPLMCLSEDGSDILLLVQHQNLEVVMIMCNLRDNSVKCIQLPNNKLFLNDSGYVQSLFSPF